MTIPKLALELMSEQNAANERNYWTKEEIKNFLFITKNELSLRDHVIFQLLIYTGARKGELLAISWEDIDFEARSLKLWKTLFQTDGKHLLQTPKTRDSKRLISLDTQSLSLLKKWRIIQMEENLAFGSRNANNNIIFTRPDGTPLRLAYLNEKLNILIKRHNLHPITIHGLRHTHASLLFEAGANIKEVQERLGHSDIQMTMNDYTHVTVY
ncbi:site-specific integrase [Metabacillus sediminilitoris]|uniref:Site-specific integrase n=2 Tax=Metabacillus sediminilitoris TaxID=2567941 RepID=A0A4S4BP50_9BACI|nr:tyrosine-type recombinase/integrase [Metabacillus sediminilitoris]THF76128.1 site-specific integrase [Metabacillus sediminilitoris]